MKLSASLVTAIVAVLFLFFSLTVSSCSKKKENETKKEQKTVQKTGEKKQDIYKVELGKSPAKGVANASATMVVFSDFQCPFSKRFFELTDKIMSDYKDKISFVFKHYPLNFHKDAKSAAKAAIAAEKQGKFWEMYKKLFENQKELSDENYKLWAKELGLDVVKFEADLISAEVEATLNTDMKQGSDFGVRGTPTIFINGARIVGLNQPVIDQTIKEQLAKGEELRASRSKNIYAELIKEGLGQYKIPAPVIPRDIYKVDLPAGTPIFGDKDALITMILIDDFECPFCGKLYTTFEELKKEYAGKIRIAYINMPLQFHAKAKPAAYGAMAAHKQGKFWEMHDLLFKTQKEWSKEADFNIWLDKKAEELMLDGAKFKKDRESAEIKELVEKDIQFAEKIGVKGTPGTFINGRFVGGAYPKESFDKVIKEELERAMKLSQEKNIKGDALYLELIKDGKIEVASRERKQTEDPNKIYDIVLAGHEPVKGSKKAQITLVEYSDFQCPHCKRGSITMNELLSDYKGSVKVVFKNWPMGFHKQAEAAAKFGIAVKKLFGDDKFWKINELLFEKQTEWSVAGYEKFFEKYAKEADLNWAKIKKEMESPKTEEILKKDLLEAQKLNIRGVPTFFVNGKKFTGSQPKQAFKILIDEKLKEKVKK